MRLSNTLFAMRQEYLCFLDYFITIIIWCHDIIVSLMNVLIMRKKLFMISCQLVNIFTSIFIINIYMRGLVLMRNPVTLKWEFSVYNQGLCPAGSGLVTDYYKAKASFTHFLVETRERAYSHMSINLPRYDHICQTRTKSLSFDRFNVLAGFTNFFLFELGNKNCG